MENLRLRSAHVVVMAVVAFLSVVPNSRASITTSGDVTPDPTTTTINDSLYIGQSSAGTMSMTLGSYVQNDDTFLGYDAGVTGQATVDGDQTTWSTIGNFHVGWNGSGSLSVTNRGFVHDNGSFIGKNAGSDGNVTVDGGQSEWQTGKLQVGYQGTGSLHVTNSGLVETDLLSIIGSLPGSVGHVTVDNFGRLILGKVPFRRSLWVGNYGNASLTIAGGGLVTSSSGFIAFHSDSTATVTVDGANSAWNVELDLTVAESFGADGTLSVANGGRVAVGRTLTLRNGSTLSFTIASTNDPFIDVGGGILDTKLAGTLNVALADGYVPALGDTFTLIDVGVGLLTGTFANYGEGDVVLTSGNRDLRITYAGGNGNDLELVATLVGDFDLDNDVDGFDFLKWQLDPSVGSLADWEANYGMVAPISATSTAIPEPTTCGLALAALCLAMSRRRSF